jgi:hypothetical protein
MSVLSLRAFFIGFVSADGSGASLAKDVGHGVTETGKNVLAVQVVARL